MHRRRFAAVLGCFVLSCGQVRSGDTRALGDGNGGATGTGGAAGSGGVVGTVEGGPNTPSPSEAGVPTSAVDGSVPDAAVVPPSGDEDAGSGPSLGETDDKDALHAVQIDAGMRHTCAVFGTGEVACWGSNAFGQLGDGTTTDSAVPARVVGLTDAALVQAGAEHTCALRKSGAVVCWGAGGFIGDGTATQRLTPVPVKGLLDAKHLSAGYFATCAVVGSGEVRCWGADLTTLKTGALPLGLEPAAVPDIADAQNVTTGVGLSCAVRDGGHVVCWGVNYLGQQGGMPAESQPLPRTVPELDGALSVALGAYHTCAIDADHVVKCLGSNIFGGLGDGSRLDTSATITVKSTRETAALSAEGAFSVALSENGQVRYWGTVLEPNGSTPRTYALAPARLHAFDGAAEVAAGYSHACARFPSGAVGCWGDNTYGELGDGTRTNRNRAVFVQKLP